MNSKLIKLDENNSSATTTTNKPAATTTTTTTTTGTINSTSNNEIDIVADSSNDETCEFSLEPYHQKSKSERKRVINRSKYIIYLILLSISTLIYFYIYSMIYFSLQSARIK